MSKKRRNLSVDKTMIEAREAGMSLSTQDRNSSSFQPRISSEISPEGTQVICIHLPVDSIYNGGVFSEPFQLASSGQPTESDKTERDSDHLTEACKINSESLQTITEKGDRFFAFRKAPSTIEGHRESNLSTYILERRKENSYNNGIPGTKGSDYFWISQKDSGHWKTNASIDETEDIQRESSTDQDEDFQQEASTDENFQRDDSGESLESSLLQLQHKLSSFKSDSTDLGLSAAKTELQSLCEKSFESLVSYVNTSTRHGSSQGSSKSLSSLVTSVGESGSVHLPENQSQRNDFIRVRPKILEFQKRENRLTIEMTSVAKFPLLLKIKSQSRKLRAFPSRSFLRVGETLQVQLLKSDDGAAMQWDSYQGPIKDAFGNREKEVVTVRILTTAQPRGCGPPFTLSEYREMWRSTPEENISVKRLECIIHGVSSPEKDDSTFEVDKNRLRSSEGFSTTMVDKGEIGDFTSIQHLLDHVDTRGSLTMLDTSTQTVSSRKSTGPLKWWVLVFLLLILSLLPLVLLDINMFWWKHPDEETTFECKSPNVFPWLC